MPAAKFDEQPQAAYASLEKSRSWQLLDAIDDALDDLETDPSSNTARQRSFPGAGFGMTVRTRDDDWLIVWEHDSEDDDVIRVRYLGIDPFA